MELAKILLSGTTIVAVLASGGIMLWLLNKPKVFLVRSKGLAWNYSYAEGNRITAVQLAIEVVLQNKGVDATNIVSEFVANLEDGEGERISQMEEGVILEGKGQRLQTPLFFNFPVTKELSLNKGILHGRLRIIPWGNRRLGIFGKRTFETQIALPLEEKMIFRPGV